jgi:hypothetical protein
VSLAGNPTTRYGSGTSYAAPYVAGAVALALSLDPVLTSEAILDLVERTADPLDDLDGRVASGGMLDAGALITEFAEGGACPTTRVPSSGFRDVPATASTRLGVDCIAWWGITRGRTADEYQPRSPVTRGQMATFLATVVDAGPACPTPPSAFPDVAGSVHEGAINALARAGHRARLRRRHLPAVAAGHPGADGEFLVNTYEHLVGDAPSRRTTVVPDTRGSVHEAAAESLWELGITAGTATRVYDPHPDVRRDQMGSFVARLLDRLVRDEVIAPR